MQQTFKTYIDGFTDLIGNTITGLLLTTATALFFAAVVHFIYARSTKGGDAMVDAKNRLMWSIIALFVMFSVWGIIKFFQVGLGVNGTTTIDAPSVRANPNRASGANGGTGSAGGPGGATANTPRTSGTVQVSPPSNAEINCNNNGNVWVTPSNGAIPYCDTQAIPNI
jgi:uncharacterized membrane protein (GlpM family)